MIGISCGAESAAMIHDPFAIDSWAWIYRGVWMLLLRQIEID